MNFITGCAHQCLLNWFGHICRLQQLVLKTFQENVTAALMVLKYGVQLPLTVLAETWYCSCAVIAQIGVGG